MSSRSQEIMGSQKWTRLMLAQGWKMEQVDVPRGDGLSEKEKAINKIGEMTGCPRRYLPPSTMTPCMVKGGVSVPIPNGAVSRKLIGLLVHRTKRTPRRK